MHHSRGKYAAVIPSIYADIVRPCIRYLTFTKPWAIETSQIAANALLSTLYRLRSLRITGAINILPSQTNLLVASSRTPIPTGTLGFKASCMALVRLSIAIRFFALLILIRAQLSLLHRKLSPGPSQVSLGLCRLFRVRWSGPCSPFTCPCYHQAPKWRGCQPYLRHCLPF